MKFLVRVAAELAPYVFAGGLAYLSLRNQKRGAGSFLAKLLCVAPLAILVYLKFFLVRVQFPDNLIGNDFFVDPEFLDERTVRSLLHLTRRNTLPSNNRDTQFYARHVDHEHIGEATPLSPHGDCSQHALLIPDTTNTSCVLPSRVDVARHFLTTGGVGGRKELVETGISRLLSFGRYMFNVSDYPEAQRLFESPKFQAAASRMCPDDQQFLDPVQFNFIVQVPGQSVATHLDGVYFWGASRFQFPQWLLAAMKFSNLWEDKFVHQVQVVAYYHQWKDEAHVRGGQFALWTDTGEPHMVNPDSGTASIVDGSKNVHTATVYWPDHPAGPPPVIDKEKDVFLAFRDQSKVDDDEGELTWDVIQDGKILRSYNESEIRFSLVYRARCFNNSDEVDKYHQIIDGTAPKNEIMELEDVLQRFQEDMVSRGSWKGSLPAAEDSAGRLKFATAILDTYVKYPLPTSVLVPFNYCALGHLVPFLKPVIKLIC